jgi:hypothetical protein
MIKKVLRHLPGYLLFLLVITLVAFVINSRASITGSVVGLAVEEVNETIPSDVSEAEALKALMQAESDAETIRNYIKGPTYLINDTLILAKRYFIGQFSEGILIMLAEATPEEAAYLQTLLDVVQSTPESEIKVTDYAEVLRLTRQIAAFKEQASRLVDGFALYQDKQRDFRGQGVNTSLADDIFEQSRTSFREERFGESETLLEDANLKISQLWAEQTRFKSILKRTRNFFQKFWKQSLIVFVLIVVTAPSVVLRIRRHRAKGKLAKIRVELVELGTLLVKAQEDCFKYRTITETAYKVKSEAYKTRINEIKRTIPVLESIIRGEKKPKEEGKQEGSGLNIK